MLHSDSKRFASPCHTLWQYPDSALWLQDAGICCDSCTAGLLVLVGLGVQAVQDPEVDVPIEDEDLNDPNL